MLEISELRDQSPEELQLQLRELSKEIYDLKSEMRITRKLEKPHMMREKKRDRARLHTVLREKEA